MNLCRETDRGSGLTLQSSLREDSLVLLLVLDNPLLINMSDNSSELKQFFNVEHWPYPGIGKYPGTGIFPPEPSGPTLISPVGIRSPTPVKYDEGKIDWTLLPIDAVEEIIKVLMFGAKKYSADNWRAGTGFSYKRVWKSLTRHIFAWIRGEDNDPESGLSHLAHAGCCILFLLHYVLNKDKFIHDDR